MAHPWWSAFRSWFSGIVRFDGRCLYPLIPVGGLVRFENLNQMPRVIVLLTSLTTQNRLLVRIKEESGPAIWKII